MVSRPRRYRGSLLLALLGCRGPDDALGAPPDPAESSTSGDATSSMSTAQTTGGGSVPETDDEGGDPSRVPAFEWPPLPEGCGDGVVVPGQYDCFRAIELPRDLVGFVTAMDSDGDGRDELWAYGPTVEDPACDNGRSCNPLVSVRLARDGDRIEVATGPLSVALNANSPRFTDRDLTGNGHRDLALVESFGWLLVHEGLGTGVFAPLQWVNVWNGEPIGFPTPVYPIDPDGDGRPEFLVNEFGMGGAARLRREVDGVWTSAGPPLQLPGCQRIAGAAYGDFDEDGVEDIAIKESGWGCDPYPEEYDPEHYRLSVFTSDPSTGLLVQQPTFATGGLAGGGGSGFWSFDVDGDGHLDLVLNSHGVAVAIGHGDGTFEDGEIRDELNEALDGLVPPRFYALGDFDGDGSRELTGSVTTKSSGQEQWIVGSSLTADTLALHYPFRLTGSSQTGDFNGDGITDFVTRHPDDELKRDWLMVSTP